MSKSKKTPYFDLIQKLEEEGYTLKFKVDLKNMSIQELIQFKEELKRKALEHEYGAFEVTKELKRRHDYLEKQLEKAKYDRENSDLNYNFTNHSIN